MREKPSRRVIKDIVLTCNVSVEFPISDRVLLSNQPPELSIQPMLLDDAVHLLALILLLFVCNCEAALSLTLNIIFAIKLAARAAAPASAPLKVQ